MARARATQLAVVDAGQPGWAERVHAFPRILSEVGGSHRVSEVLVMKALIESIGRVGSRTSLGGHELIFDQPSAVPGGEDRGPSPLDVMYVSVAACAHYFAAAYLHGRGLSPEGLAIEVTAEKERLPVSRIGRLEMKVRLPAGLTDRQVAGIERAIKSCPAYGTLLHPPAVELSGLG